MTHTADIDALERCYDERPPRKCGGACWAAANGLSDCAVSAPQPNRDGMTMKQAKEIMSRFTRVTPPGGTDG